MSHPGLHWRFDAHFGPDTRGTYRDDHVRATCGQASDLMAKKHMGHALCYRRAYDRRAQWLRGRSASRSLPLAGRLETGIGEPGVYECQLTLHPRTGLPVLHGSGMKGLLAAWCWRQHMRLQAADPTAAAELPEATLEALFGGRPGHTAARAGLLVVHDAWWDPFASTRGPLEPERVTPHHVDHYAGLAGAQATDLDSPNPVPRLAAAGAFLVAVDHAGIGAEWALRCLDWLQHALSDSGAGAARTLGYGRFAAPA